ncbi:MAG: hypothetical protein Q7T20_17685 [Saprospiraceae bacterium]|nr:hypothetical protein [Saprospiraceae bacterium]
MRASLQLSLLVLLAFMAITLQAQDFYRFKADFSIKEKETGKDQGRLITGTLFYDKNLHKTVYNIRFPEREQWLLCDTFMYRMKADRLVSKQIVPPVGEFSIFKMILDQELIDFGLAKVGYTPAEVMQDGEQVLSKWFPPESLKTFFGPITFAQQNKRLHAAAIHDPEDKVVAKFYFQDYSVQNGLPVPAKIYQIFYRETGEFVRIMNIKNIIINQSDEDSLYDFGVPAGG